MFYEILNLRAPNVSNFAEALKVADPSTFKDSWKLADGFVAAEGMFKIDAKFSKLKFFFNCGRPYTTSAI